MAATVTTFGSDNRAIERDPIELVWEVNGGLAALTNDDSTLRALPNGTVFLSAEIACIQAEAGATSSKLDLRVGGGSLLAGASDNGGTLSVLNSGIAAGTFTPTASGGTTGDVNLNARVNIVGTPSTAPIWRVRVLCLRTSF